MLLLLLLLLLLLSLWLSSGRRPLGDRRVKKERRAQWALPVTPRALALTGVFPEGCVPGTLIPGGTHGSEEVWVRQVRGRRGSAEISSFIYYELLRRLYSFRKKHERAVLSGVLGRGTASLPHSRGLRKGRDRLLSLAWHRGLGSWHRMSIDTQEV